MSNVIKEYESKRSNYHMGHRIDDLRNMVEIQCSKGNVDQGEYMRGMANGLLLAWNTLMEPYDDSPELKELRGNSEKD